MRVKSLRWPFCVTDIEAEPTELSHPYHPLAFATVDEAMSFFWRQRQWSISFDFQSTVPGAFSFTDALQTAEVANEKVRICDCGGFSASALANYSPGGEGFNGLTETEFSAFWGADCDGVANDALDAPGLLVPPPQNEHLLRYTNDLGVSTYYPLFYFALRFFADAVVDERISTLRAEVDDTVGVGSHLVETTMQVNGKSVRLFYRAPDGDPGFNFNSVQLQASLYHSFANSSGGVPIYNTVTGARILDPFDHQNPFE